MSVEYEFTPGSSWGAASPPRVVRVVIESWSGDEPIVRGYANLTDAERALRDAAEVHLDAVGGYAHALVRIEWSDGASHRAEINVDAEGRGWRADGLIKGFLLDQGLDLTREPEADLRAWGAELRHRLLRDTGANAAPSEWKAWSDSLAFIPSDGAPPPPLDAVIVAVSETSEPPKVGTAWGSLAQGDAAVARFVAARRAAHRGGYVHVTVAWRDGMRFRTWGSVADLAARPLVLVNEMDACARYIASAAFADRNARIVPRRPLEPQRAWARELVRRAAVLAGGAR